jgi:hypothetical protein
MEGKWGVTEGKWGVYYDKDGVSIGIQIVD